MPIERFVQDNIQIINDRITNFRDHASGFSDIDIKNHLQSKLTNYISNPDNVITILDDLSRVSYVKARVIDIANARCFYKPHLEKFYKSEVLKSVFNSVDLAQLADENISLLSNRFGADSREIAFINSDLKSLLNKSLFLVSLGGFSSDLQRGDSGLRVANEGDSAQFLFVARAILAGFNCSNVDVRSSRYDVIIDYANHLLRIQVKGITSGSTVSFFDRDRGGQGIDHTHSRNRGGRITAVDCDIYVAVDKQVGSCYIIPMSYADALDESEARNVSLVNIQTYLENWKTIIDVATRND